MAAYVVPKALPPLEVINCPPPPLDKVCEMLARLFQFGRRSPIRFSRCLQSLQRRSTGTQLPDASGEAFKNKGTSSPNWEVAWNNFRNNSTVYGVVLASMGAIFAAARHLEKTKMDLLMLKEKSATELARVEAEAKAEKVKSEAVAKAEKEKSAAELARVEAVATSELNRVKEKSAAELARVEAVATSELGRVKAELAQAVAVAEKNAMQQFCMYGYSNEYKQFLETTRRISSDEKG